MKKIVMCVAMILITFALIEVLCSAALFYQSRALGQVAPFAGEPKLSTVLAIKKIFTGLVKDHNAAPAKVEAVAAAQPETRRQSRTPRLPDGQTVISDPYPFYIADPEFGYVGKPGSYLYTYQKKRGEFYNFFKNKVTVLADKTRYVGKTPEKPERHVYIFGDSFIFGESINDEQTFTYLLQNTFDHYAFHLYAMGGYGDTQTYLNYKKLAPKITANDIIIIGYADYYKPRDVAAPSRLREFGEPRPIIKDDKIKHTKVNVTSDGAIHIGYVPLFCKYNKDYCAAPDPAPEEMNKVSSALINAVISDTPAKVFVLHFWGSNDDPVLKTIPAKATIIRATQDDFDYEIKDDIMGFDGHPGPFWHYAMFSRIAPFLKQSELAK